MSIYSLTENYRALQLAILSPIRLTAEGAFLSLAKGRIIRGRQTQKISRIDAEEMMQLKNRMTFKQIGDLYGLTADAVYHRIKRLEDGFEQKLMIKRNGGVIHGTSSI